MEWTIGELEKGTIIGRRWRVVYRIDSGGSSVVYLVVEIGGRERTAALKIRRMDTDHPKELFENEIRFLRAQPIRGDMPEWFDNGEHEGRPYVVMTLLAKLPRQMSVKEAKRYFLQAARILKRLHARGIIHGDIKLDNFALMDGKVVLADFATASYVEEGKDSVPLVMTPFYAAPELLAGKTKGRLTYRTDVYAFGVAFEFACSDKAASVFDKVHRLTVAATPTRRCDDWDVISRAIRWAGRKRLIAAVAGAVVLLAAAFFGMRFFDSLRMEQEYRERNAGRMSTQSLVYKGYSDYRSGDMKSAYENLGKAIHSPDFRAEEYPYFDVMGFYEDARRHVNEKKEVDGGGERTI